MPPGIIKDPSQSPGVIYRADAKSPIKAENTKHFYPATILIGDDSAQGIPANTPVIFDIVQDEVKIQYGQGEIVKTVLLDVAVNVEVAPNAKKGKKAPQNKWKHEWDFNVEEKIRNFFEKEKTK